jgi:hypothetical protein
MRRRRRRDRPCGSDAATAGAADRVASAVATLASRRRGAASATPARSPSDARSAVMSRCSRDTRTSSQPSRPPTKRPKPLSLAAPSTTPTKIAIA